MNLFGESIAGAATIRGFGQEKRFMKRNLYLSLVDEIGTLSCMHKNNCLIISVIELMHAYRGGYLAFASLKTKLFP
jgi:hypothetical protein